MTTCELHLNKLCDSLRQVLCNDVTIEKNADSFQLLITDINSTDISIDLEISFRTIVSEIFVDKHTKKENTDTLFFKFLEFSIYFADTYSTETLSHRRVPFLLIEDALDGLTIEESLSIWGKVESLADVITKPDFFAKGKFIILRTCNSLLRKLSKSCNTEYCGRVLMFLASVYPISERSSVNVNGKVNTGNVTIYADEKEFLAALDAESSKERMGESSTTVLGNSSSMGVVETKVDDITAMEEDGEEKETPVTPPVSTTGKPSILPSSSSSSSLNTKTTPSKVATMSQYEIYKSFWHLQTLLNTEVKKMDAELGLTINPTNFTVSQATVTPVGKPTPPVPGNNKSGAKSLATATTATVSSTTSTTVGDLVNGRTVAWSALITHIDIVLELFESKPFSASEITQAREKVKNSVTRCLRDHLEARNNWISQFRLDHERATNRNSNGMLVDTEHISQSNNAHEGHSANNNNAVEEEYMGCKYLTSPTLFELQLRDTTLRQEVLVQILLFLHNLRTRLTSVLDSAVAAATLHAATAPVLVSTSRFVKGKPPVPTPVLGKDGKPVTSAASGSGSGSATTSSPRDIIKGSPIAIAITTISKDITRIRKRTFSILLSTPPNGEELALFLRCLLDREQNWITWKQQSCPDFERPPISWASLVSVTSTTTTSTNSANATADNLSSDTATGTKKRKLESVGSKPTSHSVTPSGDIFRRTQTFLADTELESAAKHALNIVSAVPSFELHVQSYIDAENPDNGIEGEYHPKKDEVYCWRARRLMSLRRLSALEFMADGSISNGLRSILGKDIFGPVSDTAVVSITDIETIILDETQGDADVKPEGNAESADDMGAQFYPTPTQVMDMTDSDALEEVLGVGTGQAPVDGVDEGDMDDDNNDSGGGQEDSKNVQYVTTSIEEGEEEDIVMEDGEEAS